MKSIAETVIGKIIPAAKSMFDMANGAVGLYNKASSLWLKMGKDGKFDKKIRLEEIQEKIKICEANLQADPPPDAIQRVKSFDENQCFTGMYYLNAMWKNPPDVFSTEEAKKYRNTETYIVQPNELQFFIVKENLFFANDIQGPFSGEYLPNNSTELPEKPSLPPTITEQDSREQTPAEVEEAYQDYEEAMTEYNQRVKEIEDPNIKYPLQMYEANGEKWGDKVYVSFQPAIDSIIKKLETNLEESKVKVIQSRKTIKIDEGSDSLEEELSEQEDETLNKIADKEEWKVFTPTIDSELSQFLVDTQKIYDECAILGKCGVLDKGNKNALITEKLLDWGAWQQWVKTKIKNKFETAKTTGVTPAPNLDSFKNIIVKAEYRTN